MIKQEETSPRTWISMSPIPYLASVLPIPPKQISPNSPAYFRPREYRAQKIFEALPVLDPLVAWWYPDDSSNTNREVA
jgi:hypothetical protein